jgi:TldD protein
VDGTGQEVIATSDGTCIEIDASRIFFTVTAVARNLERLVSAREFDGRREGFDIFDRIDLESIGRKASQRAVSLLDAKAAPSGRYTVVIDPKLAGTFVHEAVGHACEADLVVSGESILQGMLGKKIGSDLVTIHDDPTLENGWGSYKYDDEGVPAAKRILVEKGNLIGYISNKETSAKLSIPCNGGARAESYAARPIVRMSNTYMLPGDHSVDELFEKVESGIYAKCTRGGQVDTSKGTFQFSAEEAYLIEKGKLTVPLLDVSLSGMTLETLQNIEAISRDVAYHPGFCGKASQSIPAGDGAPHLLVQNVVVGGRP